MFWSLVALFTIHGTPLLAQIPAGINVSAVPACSVRMMSSFEYIANT